MTFRSFDTDLVANFKKTEVSGDIALFVALRGEAFNANARAIVITNVLLPEDRNVPYLRHCLWGYSSS